MRMPWFLPVATSDGQTVAHVSVDQGDCAVLGGRSEKVGRCLSVSHGVNSGHYPRAHRGLQSVLTPGELVLWSCYSGASNKGFEPINNDTLVKDNVYI